MIDSRAKGKRGELEVARLLRAHGWPDASRTSDGRAQAARGDIQHGPEGWHIEVKCAQRLNVAAALDQVMRDAPPLHSPLLIHRPVRHPWCATVLLEDLFPLLRGRG